MDFLALVAQVEASQSGAASYYHGPDHWRKVAFTGLTLAAAEPCDTELVLLFALLHDSQRQSENDDPQHGHRAAAYARSLPLGLEPERLAVLLEAIEHHDSGQVSQDPTIAVCWDADRLNLWRVGIVPSPRFLSTASARASERILWAARLQKLAPQWTEILQAVPSPQVVLSPSLPA